MISKLSIIRLGYKLRTQIANGLKRRSKAIKTAVDEYNDAAGKLDGNIKNLDVKDVLEFVFLGEFDILRNTRRQICKKPWSRRAERETMNIYFKLLRAQEEIRRLNIEVRRLITFIYDYHKKMSKITAELARSNAKLGHQLQKRARLRKEHDINHLRRLRLLSSMEGFSGTLDAGRRVGGGVSGNDNVDEMLDAFDGQDGAGASDSDDGIDLDLAMHVDLTLDTVLSTA